MKTLEETKKVVVSLSGGLDSTTLLYLAVKTMGNNNVYALSFDYHQRHNIELELAKRTCMKLEVNHKIIDIGFLGDITKNVSAMVKGSIPTLNATDSETGKKVLTYIPFRNTILSGIVLAYAEAIGADAVALGMQYGDYENNQSYYYWDCSKEFVDRMQALADLNDKHKISYIAPFASFTKKDEIKLGLQLGVDYADTWTCYLGGVVKNERVVFNEDPVGGRNSKIEYFRVPCGVCPSCVSRKKAFDELGIEDPQKGVWL